MVGGVVVEVVELEDRYYVNCRSLRYTDECAIHIKKTEFVPSFGDKMWWQGSWAFWTPADKKYVEKKIPRIGYSGVRHPNSPVKQEL